MENKELSPSESLALIANVIMEAKTRFRDNGFAFIFLGLCSFVSSLGQFVLLELKLYKINYFPYFIMPLAGALTFFYYSRKRREVKSKNIIGFLLSALGIFLGINMTIAGFFFWNRFGIALIPFMLVLFSIWPVLTGVLIKNKIFIFIGTIINLIAYGAFFVDRIYHPLVLSIVSLIGIVLPGILLNSRK
jgi:hypothetical protein